MLDRTLHFKDSLDAVQQGQGYCHARLGKNELSEAAEAIYWLNSLLKMSSLAGEGLFERWEMPDDGLGGLIQRRRIARGEMAGDWDKGEWQPTLRIMESKVGMREWYETVLLPKQNLWAKICFSHENLADWYIQLPMEIATLCNEMMLNCVERGAEHLARFEPHPPNDGVHWSVDLHVSRTGLLLSTQNLGEFHPYAHLKRLRMAPRLTPDGKPIDFPRYWYDFGNGEGFIRGNGFKIMLTSPDVRVRFQNSKGWVMGSGWRHDHSCAFVPAYAFASKVLSDR